MKIRSSHLRDLFVAELTSLRECASLKENEARETEIVEVNQELSHYAHCKLPEHYFDMLLFKQQAHIQIRPPQYERREVVPYR